MKKIIDILKGIIIGIANIIPGVSGGTLAVVMGIFEKLIMAITTIFKHPIKTIKEIWPYIIGIGIGIVIGVVAVSYMLERYPLPTTSLFVGLIIGAIPLIFKNVNRRAIAKKDVIFFVLMFLIVIGMPFLSMIGLESNSQNPIIYLVLGVVAAASMVIPGVSGSMMLMALGYYDKILGSVSLTMKSALSLNFSIVWDNIIILLPFAIGIIIGIIAMAQLIKWLILKFNQTLHCAILGLLAASPIVMFMELNYDGIRIWSIVIAVITFTLGYFIANWFNRFEGEK